MNRTDLYTLIYALAATDGREATLFGEGSALAQEAFGHSVVGKTFPELWFEFPLKGDPWFDLHVATDRDDVEDNAAFSDSDVYYPHMFEWFAAQNHDVRQLILSHDVSSGSIDKPAIQLLLWRRNTELACNFLETAGDSQAANAYRSFMERLPEGWFACYTGVFPSRPSMGVRVECIPNKKLQGAYAQDVSLLEEHLRQVGINTTGTTILPWYQKLAQFSFQTEFQLNIAPDGSAEPTLGLSLHFKQPKLHDDEAFRVDGNAGALMRQIQDWGLADDRWRLFSDAIFAKRVSFKNNSVRIYCFPAFLKLRWRDGEPYDAKVYCVAGTQQIST